MSFKLRPYQQQAIDSIEKAWGQGFKSVCHQSPTGSGKSVIFRSIVENHYQSKKVIYVIAHRKNLVRQLSGHLTDAGVDHGFIMSGQAYLRYRVQACSMQTLISRLDHLPEPEIIIVDEGHHARSASFMRIFEKWPNAKVLLETATPSRPDGKPLSDVADILITGPEPQYLIDKGYLSEYDYYAPPGQADMTGVHLKMGEFVQSEVLQRVQNKAIIGSAIEHYREYSHNLPAIAACVNIAHTISVAKDFNDAGYKAKAVHSKMSDSDVERAIKELADGTINVLCNADLLGEGTDIPVVTTLIGLRPTNSQVIFLQHCGRVLRKSPGKKKAIILDHVGNWERHGLPADPRVWSLTGSTKKEIEPSKYKKCPECYHPVPISSRVCPNCDFSWVEVESVGSRMPKEKDGRLVRIQRNDLVLEVARNAKTFLEAVEIAGEIEGQRIWVDVLRNKVITIDTN